MKQLRNGLLILAVLVFLISCASAHPGRYNTQRGAAIGAGLGALSGQLIGRNTKSTLIIIWSGAESKPPLSSCWGRRFAPIRA